MNWTCYSTESLFGLMQLHSEVSWYAWAKRQDIECNRRKQYVAEIWTELLCRL